MAEEKQLLNDEVLEEVVGGGVIEIPMMCPKCFKYTLAQYISGKDYCRCLSCNSDVPLP